MARASRSYPRFSLEKALEVLNALAEHNSGKPLERILLAKAMGRTPTSSKFEGLVASAKQYGLVHKPESTDDIGPTDIGTSIIKPRNPEEKVRALRDAALRPEKFKEVLEHYNRSKLPEGEFFHNVLERQFSIPESLAAEFEKLLKANSQLVGFIEDISGSPHVLIQSDLTKHSIGSNGVSPPDNPAEDELGEVTPFQHSGTEGKVMDEPSQPAPESSEQDRASKPIFIGHGKNKGPLNKLEKMLQTFGIPFKVAVNEANLGRPIPQKVKDIMAECGSAILIFTKDEKFYDEGGNELWRPSENVAHELGASSYAYEDRIVIFKEKGISFPSNYSSIGYIEFEASTMEAQSMDLLKELVGFGLVKITPA